MVRGDSCSGGCSHTLDARRGRRIYVKIVIWGLKNDPGRVNNSIWFTVPKVYKQCAKNNEQMSHFGGPLGAIGDMLGYDLSGYFRECF